MARPNRQTSYARSQYWIDGYFLQQTFGWDNKLFLPERAGLTILLSLVQVRGIRNIPKPVWALCHLILIFIKQRHCQCNEFGQSKGFIWWSGWCGSHWTLWQVQPHFICQLSRQNTYVPNAQIAFWNVAPERTREVKQDLISAFQKQVGTGLNYILKGYLTLSSTVYWLYWEGGTSRLDNVGEMSNKGFNWALITTPLRQRTSNGMFTAFIAKTKPGWKLGSPRVAINNVAGAPVYLIEGQPAGVFFEPILLPMQMEAGCWIPMDWSRLKRNPKAYVAGSEIPAGSYVEGGVLYTTKRCQRTPNLCCAE